MAASALVAAGVPAAAGEGRADDDTARAVVRDHAMGSQIAGFEGIAEPVPVSSQSSSDEPTSGIQGIDVSGHQGDVDWRYWWDQGKRFAYVKATEGTYFTNPRYDQQYTGSAAVGMRRGAYHFAIPNDSSGAAQAEFFVAEGGGWTRDGTTLPGAIDLEPNPNDPVDGTNDCYGMSKAQLTAWIGEFIDTYRRLTGRFPVIYTVTSWWSLCVGSADFGETSPLWIARWASQVGPLPAGWSSWTFWQHNTQPVDQNKFYGTAAQLQQLADGPPPTAPTSVAVRGGLGRATMSWQEPRWTGVGGVTEYRISVSPGGAVVDDIPADARSAVVPGLAAGTTYTLTLRAYSQDGAGAAVGKRLVGTKVSSTLSPTTLTYGAAATISGTVARVDTGSGSAGWTVRLDQRKKGTTTWQPVTSASTGTGGAFSFGVRPASHRDYRAVYASGNSVLLGSTSAVRSVTVRSKVTGAFADSSVRRGAAVTFAGAVSPSHAGRTVYLQHYVDGAWRTVRSQALSSTSRFGFGFTAGSATRKYRAYFPSHADHAAGYSAVRTLTVS